MAAKDEFKIVRNLFGIYDTPVIIEDYLKMMSNTAKTIQNNYQKDELNYDLCVVILYMMRNPESLPAKLMLKALSCLKRLPFYSNEIISEGKIFLGGINWKHFFTKIDDALVECFKLLRKNGCLNSIKNINQNIDFNYHIVLALLFESNLNKSFINDYLSKNGDEMPINYFLRDVLTQDQIKDFESQIPVSEECEVREDAQEQFIKRLKKKETYYGKSPGKKFLISLYSTDRNLNLGDEIINNGMLSFIYSRYIAFQHQNKNTASYKTIMSDFSEAISFLKEYQV